MKMYSMYLGVTVYVRAKCSLLLSVMTCLFLSHYAVLGFAQTPASFAEAADRMQTSVHNTFISPSGFYYTRSPDDGWDFWWNANALDTLTEAFIRTRNSTYSTRMKNLLHGIRDRHGSYINYYYDDMEWLGLASIKAYHATGDQEYLDVAQLLWNDILTGRSPEFMGSISWNKGCHPACKNAISNSPASLLGAQLYRITNSTQQLEYAKQIHAYVKNKLISPTGGVYDSWDSSTNQINTNPDWIFSYNVGMYMAASVELYNITREETYLNDAIRAAEHAFMRRC